MSPENRSLNVELTLNPVTAKFLMSLCATGRAPTVDDAVLARTIAEAIAPFYFSDQSRNALAALEKVHQVEAFHQFGALLSETHAITHVISIPIADAKWLKLRYQETIRPGVQIAYAETHKLIQEQFAQLS